MASHGASRGEYLAAVYLPSSQFFTVSLDGYCCGSGGREEPRNSARSHLQRKNFHSILPRRSRRWIQPIITPY